MGLNRIELVKQKLLAEGKAIQTLSGADAEHSMTDFPKDILQWGWKDFLDSPGYHADPKGLLNARKAIADFYAIRGVHFSPDQVLLTSGTSESYFHIFKMLANPGDRLLFPHPGYPLFEHLAGMAGIELDFYKLHEDKNWVIDLKDLEKQITSKTRAIVLISPHNPTGNVISHDELLFIAEIAKRYKLPVICDEVFSEFLFDGIKNLPRLANLSTEINVFTLNGVSKTFALPGIKLGWIAVSGPQANEFIEKLELSIDTFLATSLVSQKVLPGLLENGTHYINVLQKVASKNREFALNILQKLSEVKVVPSQGGWYLFIEILNYKGSDEDFVIELMEKTGLFVHPGYFYDYEKGLHILICYAMESKTFEKRFLRLIEFISQISGKF